LNEIDTNILSLYNINIVRTYKGRGSIMCEGENRLFKKEEFIQKMYKI